MTDARLTDAPLVRVRDLHVRFVSPEATVHAVNGVDFDLAPREVLCILGESGSGKSVTLRALMRLNPAARTVMSGTLMVGGHDMIALPEHRLADLRGGLVSMIFQDPMTALDPVFTIGRQIAETIVRHERVTRRRRTGARSTCWSWCRSPRPGAGWRPTRTSCPAACGNGR